MITGDFLPGGPSLHQRSADEFSATWLTEDDRQWYLDRFGDARSILAGRPHRPEDPSSDDGLYWRHVPCTMDALRDSTHLRIGGPKYVVFLNVDIDLPFDAAEQALAAFPIKPNLYGQNIDSGHVHAQWRLAHPVNLDNPRERANLAALQVQMTAALDGDPAYTFGTARNPLAKNSDYVWWQNHRDGLTISELRSACFTILPEDFTVSASSLWSSDRSTGNRQLDGCAEDPRGFWWDESGQLIARSRTLFEVLRHEGYELRRSGLEGISEAQLLPTADRLLTLFEDIEPHRHPVHRCEADAVIRSVVRFCNQRYTPEVGGQRAIELARRASAEAWESNPEQMERNRRECAIPARIAARAARASLDAARIRLEKESHPELTQQQIGDRLGCSQQKVSRALAEGFDDTGSAPAGPQDETDQYDEHGRAGSADSSDRDVNEYAMSSPSNTRVEQVAELTAMGLTNTEIAHLLDISMRTVRRLRAEGVELGQDQVSDEPDQPAEHPENRADSADHVVPAPRDMVLAVFNLPNSTTPTNSHGRQGPIRSAQGAQGAPHGSQVDRSYSASVTGAQGDAAGHRLRMHWRDGRGWS
ncbi:replication initiation protein [Nocardioides nitrophenolicus]|uniref:replication initiation protein n=1 Tax=Nocardioides nitrophenolicus TaxID=60489 RepID=UPI00195D5704|nr:replication initiation protein [Nocardioides nitrophenolicus]MBM7519183.1 DNA-directed RNA polymerase specialized sigma24 family protein [Nocardioides nitrophenolicus]